MLTGIVLSWTVSTTVQTDWNLINVNTSITKLIQPTCLLDIYDF